uniref:PH domain-containing protein n=1 Tax=Hanusia phi TaxID=3032 RepID=A0A7S0EUF8_9CRYP|mmetsp:Transcript_31432/g.70709  ORF Transcript_31432/g.70709 Transcript_31432/m.70709 type:complete len:275 (+) Transcript_31432:195-1019(+)
MSQTKANRIMSNEDPDVAAMRIMIQNSFLGYKSPNTSPQRYRPFLTTPPNRPSTSKPRIEQERPSLPEITDGHQSASQGKSPATSPRNTVDMKIQERKAALRSEGSAPFRSLPNLHPADHDATRQHEIRGHLELRESPNSPSGMQVLCVVNVKGVMSIFAGNDFTREIGMFRLRDTVIKTSEKHGTMFILSTEEGGSKEVCDSSIHFFCKSENRRDNWVAALSDAGARMRGGSFRVKKDVPPVAPPAGPVPVKKDMGKSQDGPRSRSPTVKEYM